MSTLNKAIDGASDAAAAAASSEALSAATDVVADAAEFVVDHASDAVVALKKVGVKRAALAGFIGPAAVGGWRWKIAKDNTSDSQST